MIFSRVLRALHFKTALCLASCLVITGISYSESEGITNTKNDYQVISPNGSLTIKFSINEKLTYEVLYNNTTVINSSIISITLDDGRVLGENATIKDTESKSISKVITLLYGKNKSLDDTYNELKINFNENYSLIARAYNEGVAYRFETRLGGTIIVKSEESNFNFSGSPSVWFPEADQNMWSWERSYNYYASIQNINVNKFAITPTMFSFKETGLRVVIAESDLSDYPGMYLQPSISNGVKGKWAQYPETVTEPDNVYAYHRVTSRFDYLARTTGDRTYPWRVVIVADQDKNLLNNELIYKLARPLELTGTDWIKPGKSVWEWWHDAILEGVSIPSGTNNLGFNLYKYYVDFAAANKIEYITLDAGWRTDYLKQLCDYAATLNVRVFLWDYINLPVTNPNRLTDLKNYGAVGVKVDLIERDDQVAMNWIEKLAKDCADRELMLLLHGCPKPTGLQRAYPNIINFEAVRGAECNKWDNTPNPDYHLQFLFIRMLAGPLDYTPGSMRNTIESEFKPIGTGIPMSLGTRSHELAMYILFDQPLGFLCDSPTEYSKYPDIMKFLSSVPTVWDQTVPLSAEVGEYACIAKKSGEDWYVGVMTNRKSRNLEVDLSFLPDGTTFRADVYRDNDKTNTDARAYTFETVKVVTNRTKLYLRLSPGGGAAIKISGGTVGIEDNHFTTGKNPIKLFFNGNRSLLNVQSELKFDIISIYDIKGIIITNKLYDKSLTLQQIDVKDLTQGMYILNLTGKQVNESIKFIK